MRLSSCLTWFAIIVTQGAVSVDGQQVITIAPRPLSNQDIIRMVKAKFDDPKDDRDAKEQTQRILRRRSIC
jgi:site-specific recombinase XerC